MNKIEAKVTEQHGGIGGLKEEKENLSCHARGTLERGKTYRGIVGCFSFYIFCEQSLLHL